MKLQRDYFGWVKGTFATAESWIVLFCFQSRGKSIIVKDTYTEMYTLKLKPQEAPLPIRFGLDPASPWTVITDSAAASPWISDNWFSSRSIFLEIILYCCENISIRQPAVLSQIQALTPGGYVGSTQNWSLNNIFFFSSKTSLHLPNLNPSGCVQCQQKQFPFIIIPPWFLQFSLVCQIAISVFTLSLLLSSCLTHSVYLCVLCSLRNYNLNIYNEFVWNSFLNWHD